MASKPQAFTGNPFDPLGLVKLVSPEGKREELLHGPLEKFAPGIWMHPHDESLLFNGRGVRVLDGRGAIHQPWTVMAVNY